MKKDTTVSIKKIAEDLGVSATTVSRALSGKGRIGQATIDRIQEYLEQKGVEPNVYAKEPEHATHMICVTLPAEENAAELPYFQKILLSVYDFFIVYGYNVIVIKTTPTDISALEHVVNRHLADGVVLTRAIADGMDIRFLQEKNVPFVVTGSYDNRNVLQVDVDQLNGCCDLTMSLLRMGIRKMALFATERSHMVSRDRYRGFERAYEQLGLDVDRDLVFENVGHAAIAEHLTENMIKQGAECILCMDDNICMYVLNALRKIRADVPGDIKVASFFNSRMLNDYYPSISCVEFNVEELGTVACKVLLDRLNGDEALKRIVLGYNVILKDSTK